jgi:hypothetical protein
MFGYLVFWREPQAFADCASCAIVAAASCGFLHLEVPADGLIKTISQAARNPFATWAF